jgi:hypothetical protein
MAPEITRPNTIELLLPAVCEEYIFYLENTAVRRTLRHSITEAFARVTEVMLVNTWNKMEYRLDVLRADNGSHIETC